VGKEKLLKGQSKREKIIIIKKEINLKNIKRRVWAYLRLWVRLIFLGIGKVS